MSAPGDLQVEFHGSIVLVRAQTQTGKDWQAEHCPAGESQQYWAGALVVESRFIEALLLHAFNDGLTYEL